MFVAILECVGIASVYMYNHVSIVLQTRLGTQYMYIHVCTYGVKSTLKMYSVNGVDTQYVCSTSGVN